MAFDPYETWLGISAINRPPTDYDLLGLAPFESNTDTIDRAALRRMGKVRQHQIGPRSELSQEILAELARARLVLIDPHRRAEYDAKLRAGDAKPHDRAGVAEKIVVGDAAKRVAPAVGDGLDVFAKLRAGNEPGPDSVPAVEQALDVDALLRNAVPVADGLGVLTSVAIGNPASDEPLSSRPTSRKRASLWKRRVFQGAVLASHVAVFWFFVSHAREISGWARSIVKGPSSPAEVTKSPDDKLGKAEAQPKLTNPNSTAANDGLKFDGGTRITIAKSDDLDMANADFTIFARIKTEYSGTIFSKTAATGGWTSDGKRLFIRDGKLTFGIGGAAFATTRSVDNNQWRSVAMTYTHQGRRACLFIDGTAYVIEKPLPPTEEVTSHVVRIGHAARDVVTKENYFIGRISDIHFYQRALTHAEIAGLSPAGPTAKAAHAQWHLNPTSTSGRRVPDMTRHGHDGTLEVGASDDAPRLAGVDGRDTPAPLTTTPSGGGPTEDFTLPRDGGDHRPDREAAKNVGTPEEILRKHGLKVQGLTCVLSTEAEVKEKAIETEWLIGKLEYYRKMQQEMMNAGEREQMIQQTGGQIEEHRLWIKQVDQTMREYPQYRGRAYNSMLDAEYKELVALKQRLEGEVRQGEEFLKELRAQQAGPQARQVTEASIRTTQMRYDDALREFRRLVDATNRRFPDLSKNDEIAKVLDALGKKAKRKFKLVKSPEFEKNAAMLERLESQRNRRK